jgi:glutamate decarboxylase
LASTTTSCAWAGKATRHYSVFDLSDKLREQGWQVPAYTMPPKVDDLAVLRIVVREGFSRDLAEMLLTDLDKAVSYFDSQPGHKAKEPRPQFAH